MAKRGAQRGNGQAPIVCEVQVAAAYAEVLLKRLDRRATDQAVRALLPAGTIVRPYYFDWYSERHAPPPEPPPKRKRARRT